MAVLSTRIPPLIQIRLKQNHIAKAEVKALNLKKEKMNYGQYQEQLYKQQMVRLHRIMAINLLSKSLRINLQITMLLLNTVR